MGINNNNINDIEKGLKQIEKQAEFDLLIVQAEYIAQKAHERVLYEFLKKSK